MYNRFINWLESHELACYNKALFGIECPGCGMQRAFIELLKGNFIESLKLYPALIPIMIMIVFAAFHLTLDIKKGALILKILFIFNVALILINYIYKLIFIY